MVVSVMGFLLLLVAVLLVIVGQAYRGLSAVVGTLLEGQRAQHQRLEVLERELDVMEPEEHGGKRRRRLWLQELEKQELTPEEKAEWQAGM